MALLPRQELALGLRANAGQFALLVGVNALVGGMVGQERAVVPLMASETFGLTATYSALTFLVAFGAAKAVTNLLAGSLADRFGRKPVLVAGWIVGLPVPFVLILAPDWAWVVAANVLLGINQGLTWSTTVLMKIDLAGPRRRGLALGLNEASGYVAVGITAFLTGLVAESAGLRPAPFFIGIAIAGMGLGASVLLVHETHGHAAIEGGPSGSAPADAWRRLAWRTSLTDPSLSAASQAGFFNNLNDGLAWGLLPIVQAAAGLSIGQIGLLAAAYPATWGLTQVATGALSDRVGRKRLIAAGMVLQAVAIASIAVWTGFVPWLAAAVALGLGTAMVYPTLIAVVADVAPARQRGSIVGVYRFWRDFGFAAGAILIGLLADRFGASASILVVAALTAGSGLIVALRMRETRPVA
ncbi:MAG: MFS transporter [Candidatus Limnocylindrales bacterium]|nr:MFS transporter [Candidatus Limnocylindrales bacterium]